MEKKSSRCFSRFLCCSARTPSSPDAKHGTRRPSHASTTAEGPSSKIPPIQDEGQNCGSSSSMVVDPNHAGSLSINSAPTVPSSSNPSPFSHNNVMERGSSPSSNAITDNEPLPSSSKVQSACSFQANPSPTPDVLEESSSQLSDTAVAHNDEPQLILPSASSSRVTRVTALSDLINNIREDAQTVNQTLDAVIDKISKALDAIKESESQKSKESKNKPEIILSQESESQKSKESQKKPEKTTNKLLSITSAGLLKLKDLLLEGVNGICSLNDALPSPEASKIAREVVRGIGQAHWVTSGFLLVAYILDRYETVSSNREACLSLLEQMYWLARDIKQIMNLEGQEGLAKSGTELIAEASLTCCTQIDRREFSKFLSTSVDSAELLKFKQNLQDFNLRMIRGMDVWICSKLLCTLVRRPKPKEKKYPDHAVGIDEPFNNVTKLLQWEREERAVAVILHGFGGIGKSTLADAVFARYYVKDCKYSVVRLNSSPDIVKLQKIILKDLMTGTEEGMRMSEGTEDFDEYQDGRRKIGELLQKEEAFIYIDNVVEADSIEHLLPTRKFKDAKGLRLLITTRDIHVLNQLRNIKREVHEMQPLLRDQRKSFLREEMCNGRADINGQITNSQLDNLVEISGGVPKLLEMIAGLIRSEPDKREAYRIVMQDSEKLAGITFNGIDKYIFAYDNLPDDCKNPFLDICYFFKGWEWETVANIVGESQLKVLESRSLVSKDKDMISLHDVILTMGKEKAQDPRLDFYSRFDFTNATASQIDDFFEKDVEYLKLVKGLWLSDQACNIPVPKLNSMHNSLRIFGHKMALEEGQCEKTFDKLLVYKGETPQFPFKWSRLKNIRFLSYRPQNLTLLQEIPFRNLKHIELDGRLCSEREIPSSHIEQLQALQVLRLINFHSLKKLPEVWGKYLTENLKELTLSNCTAIEELKESISQLRSLKILKLDNCCNLRRLPKDCDSWSSSLENLNMWNCPSLKSLPSSFGEALDSDSRRLFKHKGILSDSPQSDSDSDYESDED